MMTELKKKDWEEARTNVELYLKKVTLDMEINKAILDFVTKKSKEAKL